MYFRRMLFTLPLILGFATVARAQGDPGTVARSFIQQTGSELAATVNGNASDAQKSAALQRIVDGAVDVDGFGRFSLGRFWPMATPQQQQQFLQLFHVVLMKNITGKLNQYSGVSFTIGRVAAQGDVTAVESTVTWPSYAPYNVRWMVSTVSGAPKIVDVVAQGTSMRLTQRNDYAGFLAQNGGNVDTLLRAMRQQIAG